jgi:uncharacterized HAD superfamily protein
MSKKLRIGLDIDDVLIRTGEHTLKLYNQAHGTNVTLDHWYQADPEVWGVKDMLHAVERVRYLTELDEFDDVQPVAGALEAVTKFIEDDHEIFAITGRPENVRQQTLRILERYFPGVFSHDRVFFTDHYGDSAVKVSKSEIATSLELDYFVDDQVFHANELSAARVKTILFSDNYAWNATGEDPGVVRVSSWGEIGAFFDAESAK